MKQGFVPTPPVSAMAAALRKTTERLAHELAFPSSDAPLWTKFEWDIARAAAAMQGISSLLRTRLSWNGPELWQQFLDEQQKQSVARHRRIKRLLQALDSEAGGRNVGFVALKGAALYKLGLYSAGERPMGDVDLLICPKHAAAFVGVLSATRYGPGFSTHRHQVFVARNGKLSTGIKLGEHVDNPINVEVHTRVTEHLPIAEIDISPSLHPTVSIPGLNAYPSLAALMLHLLLHAAGNIRAHALRLIQLHDISLLAARLTAADWAELLVFSGHESLWWAFVPALLTARYYPTSIPVQVIRRLRSACPPLLRAVSESQQLTDVSWSNIRIAAFPGLEWSRSPSEAVRFMRSRIWPSQEARSELKEGAAQIPDASTVPWYGLPHGARVLRWVFSRPPRVQTLLSIRAALAHQA